MWIQVCEASSIEILPTQQARVWTTIMRNIPSEPFIEILRQLPFFMILRTPEASPKLILSFSTDGFILALSGMSALATNHPVLFRARVLCRTWIA